MIQEFLVKDSKNFKKYQYDGNSNRKGIYADTCILIDNLEVYYNKSIKTLYVENTESVFKQQDKKIMTRKMFEELLKYVNWDNWMISLHYYEYDKAMISIKHLKEDTKIKEDRLIIGALAENVQEIFKPRKIINAV